MPADCLFYLCDFLEYDDLLNLFHVNRELYGISLNDMTWRRLLRCKSIEILPAAYKSWRKYYEVIHTKARLYKVEIPSDSAVYVDFTTPLDQLETFLGVGIKCEIRRGDIVHLDFDFGNGKYRNIGKYIWNGIGLDELSFEDDKDGHLPSSYTINEFINPYHWSNIPDMNIVWFDFSQNIYKVIEQTTDYVVMKSDTEYYTFLLDATNKKKKKLTGLIFASTSRYGDIPPKFFEKIKGYCLFL